MPIMTPDEARIALEIARIDAEIAEDAATVTGPEILRWLRGRNEPVMAGMVERAIAAVSRAKRLTALQPPKDTAP